MDKLKNMLKGSSHKDEDTTYSENAGQSTTSGTAQTTSTSTDAQTGSTIGSGSQANATGLDEPKKEHGVLRQLLNPAGDKYDETAYGSASGTQSTGLTASSTAAGSSETGRKGSVVDLDNVDQLRTDPEATKKEHGVLRQILNPHGLKYDNEGYGTTATEVGSSGIPEHSGSGPAELYTDSNVEKNDRGVLRQILNPGGEKYDETRYGTTATSNAPLDMTTTGTEGAIAPLPSKIETNEATGNDRGVLRQLVNPGGEKYDDVRYGETGVAAQGSDQATSTETSHLGRDAGIGAATGAGVGAAAYEADKHYGGDSTTSTQPTSTQQGTDRSFPLAGGATTTTTDSSAYPSRELPDRTAQSSTTAGDTGIAAVGPTSTARAEPIGGTDSSTTRLQPGDELASSGTTGTSHLGRDAAVGAGAGAAGVAGLDAYERSREPKSDVSAATNSYSSQPVGGNVGGHHDDEEPAPGYVHHTRGPHATDVANALDPHVPGEYPTETGEDPHKVGNREAAIIGGTGVGMASIPSAGPAADRSYEPAKQAGIEPSSAPSTTADAANATSTLPEQNAGQQQHHLGRDATLGAGVAGLGAAGYEASRSGNESAVPSSTQSSAYASQPVGQSAATASYPTGGSTSAYDTSSSSAVPQNTSTTAQPSTQEHHYGRDAAVAGGAGAVGAGAYEATQGRSDTGPASRTYPSGPSTSAYDTSSAIPASTATTAQPSSQEHHYGRDAAVAGGAGAVGAGAYEATQGREDTGAASQTYPAGASTSTYNSSSAVPASTTTTTQRPTEEHHYGRDAAVAGGAGAVGAGAYEATQDRRDADTLNRADPAAASTPTYNTSSSSAVPESTTTTAQRLTEEHHYGRDAAVAGGAGAVGAGAYETLDRPEHSDSSAGHSHNKLHKKDDPRGPTALEVMHEKHDHHKLHKKEDPRGPTGASNVIQDRHEHRLQEAREAEAAKRHEQHEHPDSEKKPSLIQRILHPGHKHEKDSSAEHSATMSPQDTATPTSRTQLDNDAYQTPGTAGTATDTADQSSASGMVTEPHTGLPMNVGKYGSGQGGTDGAANIAGYHESSASAAAPGEGSADYDKIAKANTPY